MGDAQQRSCHMALLSPLPPPRALPLAPPSTKPHNPPTRAKGSCRRNSRLTSAAYAIKTLRPYSARRCLCMHEGAGGAQGGSPGKGPCPPAPHAKTYPRAARGDRDCCHGTLLMPRNEHESVERTAVQRALGTCFRPPSAPDRFQQSCWRIAASPRSSPSLSD